MLAAVLLLLLAAPGLLGAGVAEGGAMQVSSVSLAARQKMPVAPEPEPLMQLSAREGGAEGGGRTAPPLLLLLLLLLLPRHPRHHCVPAAHPAASACQGAASWLQAPSPLPARP